MKAASRKLLFAAAFLLLLAPAADAARPRVDIAPTRIVIEPRERSGELTMVNAFSDLGTYRVQLVSNRMKPEGGYIRMQEPLDASFDPNEYVRVTPRQFSLETRGIQRIRLSVRRPEGLPEGDYRFHVLVVRLANIGAAKESAAEEGRDLRLGSNLGVSIPVVVRQGTYDGDVEIESASVLSAAQAGGDMPLLKLRLKRIGTQRDIFGAVQVYWEPPGGGEREHIGTVNNLNVFHELEYRDGVVRLKKYPQGGKVIVQYLEDHYEQGVIDEVVINP